MRFSSGLSFFAMLLTISTLHSILDHFPQVDAYVS